MRIILNKGGLKMGEFEEKYGDLYKGFYDPRALEAKNARINMVIGSRSIGKTLSYRIYLVERYLKYGEKFVYVRRYNKQSQKMKNFWDKVKDKFPDHKFTQKGDTLMIDGVTVGLKTGLTQFASMKSEAYEGFERIVYDEFLPEATERYLDKEPLILAGLMRSVFRNNNNAKVIMLANNLSSESPYYEYYKIRPVSGQRYNSKTIVNENNGNKFKLLVDFVSDADLGKDIVKDAEGYDIFFNMIGYNEMASKNIAPDSYTYDIGTRPSSAKFLMNIKTEGKVVSVWYSTLKSSYDGVTKVKVYFDNEEKDKNHNALTLDDSDEATNKILTGFRTKESDDLRMTLSEAKQTGDFKYRSVLVRIASNKILEKMNIY